MTLGALICLGIGVDSGSAIFLFCALVTLGLAIMQWLFIGSLFQENANMKGKLEEQSAELESFIYTASHDLKSPLFTIQGFAQILQDELRGRENTDHLAEHLSRMIAGVERMRVNVESLLELSRIGRTEDPFQAVSCFQLVSSIACSSLANYPNAELSINACDHPTMILGDASRLEQMFECIIRNAFDHGLREQQSELTITLEPRKDTLRIVFDDNGPGIPEGSRERVFDLFHRLNPSNRSHGVGLTMAKRIAELHHGSVWIEESNSGGTRVVIELPFNRSIPSSKAA